MDDTQFTLKDLCTSFGAEQEAYDEVMRDIEDCSTDEQVEPVDNSKPMSLAMLKASLKDLTEEHKEVKQEIKDLNEISVPSSSLAEIRQAFAEL